MTINTMNGTCLMNHLTQVLKLLQIMLNGPDSKLKMSWGDPFHLQILRSISCQLKNLCAEIYSELVFDLKS